MVCGSRQDKDPFFRDDFLQDGKDGLADAKRLFAQGEKLFRKGQFTQGEQQFKKAERELQQAKQRFTSTFSNDPFSSKSFSTSNVNYKVPKLDFGDAKASWKQGTLALLGLGAVSSLVAGRRSSFLLLWCST